MTLTDFPNVGIGISLEHCPKCNGGFALVQTRKQAQAMNKAGVLNILKESEPGLLALWGGSGLKACPKCGRLLPLPTPKQWADSIHAQLDYGLGVETKTILDSGDITPCSACGASCTGEPGAFRAVRSVSLTAPVATGQREGIKISNGAGGQPIVYADVYPDHIELDFPVCGSSCFEAMKAELKKTDLDDILALVGLALKGKETWEWT